MFSGSTHESGRLVYKIRPPEMTSGEFLQLKMVVVKNIKPLGQCTPVR